MPYNSPVKCGTCHNECIQINVKVLAESNTFFRPPGEFKQDESTYQRQWVCPICLAAKAEKQGAELEKQDAELTKLRDRAAHADSFIKECYDEFEGSIHGRGLPLDERIKMTLRSLTATEGLYKAQVSATQTLQGELAKAHLATARVIAAACQLYADVATKQVTGVDNIKKRLTEVCSGMLDHLDEPAKLFSRAQMKAVEIAEKKNHAIEEALTELVPLEMYMNDSGVKVLDEMRGWLGRALKALRPE